MEKSTSTSSAPAAQPTSTATPTSTPTSTSTRRSITARSALALLLPLILAALLASPALRSSIRSIVPALAVRTMSSAASTPASAAAAAAASNPALRIRVRKNEARGHADHGWLKTFHTFSFANYQDAAFDQFGALRVINEDRVTPGEGFGTHAHREFEIFSYIVGGNLTHRDSLNNVETLRRGDLQMTSTGTGIRHSEYNDDKKEGVHFLQIWALPHTRGLKPAYSTRHFPDAAKRDVLVQVVGPAGAPGVSSEREADGPAPVHAWLGMWATLLSPGRSVRHRISPPFASGATAPGTSKRVYVHVVQSTKYNPRPALTHADAARVRINGADGPTLGEGDGAFVEGGTAGAELSLESVGGREAEVVLFEMD